MDLDAQSVLQLPQLNASLESTQVQVHHILAGSFRSLGLYLLAFTPLTRSLSLLQSVPASGPHQFLAANPARDRVYATSWAYPPALSSWAVDTDTWNVSFVNNVNITATSSYISLPPPYTHIYSAGGPTGEVHSVDPVTGGFGDEVQQILFVPADELDAADKTRVALRYGAHAIEVSPQGYAFVPVLGTNSIEIFALDRPGYLTHVASSSSPRASTNDGPRHLVLSPDGTRLYCVTEHSNMLDIYAVLYRPHLAPPALIHLQEHSLLPVPLRSFRGDTLRLVGSPPTHVIATTRGAPGTRGWLTVWTLGNDGRVVSRSALWETPSSGGRANAIDVRPRPGGGVWVVLTDDEEGSSAVRVLEFGDENESGSEVRLVAEWSGKEEDVQGGSHAIWLD